MGPYELIRRPRGIRHHHRLASRMMGSVGKKITNNFFDCVRGILEA